MYVNDNRTKNWISHIFSFQIPRPCFLVSRVIPVQSIDTDSDIRDAVATDIIHQHSGRLDYYKGWGSTLFRRGVFCLLSMSRSNFTQFYSTKSERDKNLQKEYETQMEYRRHLQAFIDRWRYNANRAAQAQSKIKILEKVKQESRSHLSSP